MTYFELNEPLLPPHPETVGMQDLNGLIKAHLKQAKKQTNQQTIGQIAHQLAEVIRSPFSAVSLSQLDQAFIAWGFIALAIFSLAQFSQMSWTTQSLLDAALTGIGIALTAKLTWRLACSERLRWVVGLWSVLMAGGTLATVYGIFYSIGIILANLCPLWLGLCSAGYLAMGIGLRSRCFSAASVVHAIAILEIAIHPGSQFFTSGLVMALTLFFFSVVPWDMRAIEAEELCGLKPNSRLQPEKKV
jgi:hypothetical protein